jgi:hypothetical protein
MDFSITPRMVIFIFYLRNVMEEIRAFNSKPNGIVVKLIRDNNNFLIKVFDKNNDLISERSTHDLSYARRIYKLATY